MATISRASKTSSNNNTVPYVLSLEDFSIYGIILNCKPTVRLPSVDGNVYEYEMTPDLLKQILSSPKLKLSILQEKSDTLPKSAPSL